VSPRYEQVATELRDHARSLERTVVRLEAERNEAMRIAVVLVEGLPESDQEIVIEALHRRAEELQVITPRRIWVQGAEPRNAQIGDRWGGRELTEYGWTGN
jgi:hypothetical protein